MFHATPKLSQNRFNGDYDDGADVCGDVVGGSIDCASGTGVDTNDVCVGVSHNLP